MDDNMTISRRDRRAEERAAKKPWSRKKRWAVAVGVPLALTGTVAASAAIFYAMAGVQGNGRNGDFVATWAMTEPALDTSSLTVQPAGVASIAGGKLVLPELTMYPTETFEVDAAIVSGGPSQAGYITGVALPGLPAGYTATIVDGCGAKVNGSLTHVTIEVAAPATQVAGASWALTAEAGVQVRPLGSTSAAVPAGVTCAPWTAS